MNTQRLKDREYKYNQTLMKVFGDGENKKIKLVRMNYLKTSGLEIDKKLKAERGKQNNSKVFYVVSQRYLNLPIVTLGTGFLLVLLTQISKTEQT